MEETIYDGQYGLGYERGLKDGWKKAGDKVEDVFAEFGEQGIEVVARILDETFNGKKEVEY